MTLGQAERQGDLLDDVNRFCEQMLPESSVFAVLARERDRLFPDDLFADLFSDRGRRSVPPSVVATVMVLQRLEGLSDREAVERYCFDNRWRYACGVGGYAGDGWVSFAHTVLVDMRARLKASKDPRRLFRVVLDAASQAGLVGVKRVLDSTPLYDAVATMDTITLIRSAIRALLRVADQVLEGQLRAVLTSGDDYLSLSKPQIDWEDQAGREQLIDSRAKDGHACLALLDGCTLSSAVTEAAELLATVLGQDLDQTQGQGGQPGVFKVARRVAKDRVISTVDPQARHGHKSSARGFDGYKGHIAIDPHSEVITDTVVSAGASGMRRSPPTSSPTSPTPASPPRTPETPETPWTLGTLGTLGTGPARRRRRRSSMATRLMAAADSSWTPSPSPESSRSARPSRRPLPVGCSRRTSSSWTSTPTP